NIFLAAQSFGVGSVWINQLNNISETPRIRALLKEFGVPDNHVVYGLAALGYAKDTEAKEVHKKGVIHFA
ncbi:MAG: nitroreductase family protein, partial [bacterium]|nr:nitroreductase family protein [bacterium]